MGWQLAAYHSKDEWLRTALPITRDQLVRIREMFDRGDDEWMVYCCEVKREIWPRIIETLGCPPLEEGLLYFVEGVATDG
ncbi:hypothetical protein Airi02_047020 [Actinoallomurus iriomotensis]|uniref:Uncharacterized protein n=1 Tax=Actinoallomurus iriomotensis TaxID=478107 RepID=A0A9W6S420_9ACTN|nr:hypothetical protein Airi02_047020 [Actinoallomurus iriomotensis]